MSVAEIVKKVPNLSLDEMKEVARALRDAMEDVEDMSDVLAVLNHPGQPMPMAEIRKKIRLVKWQVAFDPAAEKQFSKLGKSAQQDIAKYVAKHLETDDDPRRFGQP